MRTHSLNTDRSRLRHNGGQAGARLHALAPLGASPDRKRQKGLSVCGESSASRAGARLRGMLVVLAAGVCVIGLMAVPAGASATGLSTSSCHLAAPYQHVIYIQYDNTHLSRDNPNVPSDLEQVPALKNFLAGNGTLLDNNHTPLIAHTAERVAG